jgi:hypothetical protein
MSDNKLILCVPQGWESYISCEFFEIQSHLVKLGWSKLVIDEISDEYILNSIFKAKVVLLWEAYEFIERNENFFFRTLPELSDLRKIFFCDDAHYFTSYRRQQRLRAFMWADTILATYPTKIHHWYPEISESKIRWTPHAVASFFYPNFMPATDRILLSGSRTWPYPFRQFCHLKLAKEICDVVDHPGYPGYPGDKHNLSNSNSEHLQHVGREQYADLLRQYAAMLVCGSIFNYLVAKVFEGMAAGCLMLCDRESLGPQLAELGFQEGEHYMGTDIFHVQDDVQRVKIMFLEENTQWKTIVEKSAEKVLEEHTTSTRAKQIHQISIC